MSDYRESVPPEPLAPLPEVHTSQSSSAPDAANADDQSRIRILVAYKQMLAYQFGGAAVLSGVLTLVLWATYSFGRVPPPLLVLIMLAGMLGAFFSALTRLYNVDQASVALITPTVRDLGGFYMMMYSFVPPVIGAIAAVVLYLVFVGKLVGGGIFPQIGCLPNMSCLSLSDLMNNYWPVQPEDYGKALVWAFAAGFSERLVPDLLQSLVAKETGSAGG
jgi:hypothetical protein